MGVQVGLKSYAWFQNWTSSQREFDLKSQVWFQIKTARYEGQLSRSFVKMYTHLVAVGLEVEEQDVELREEINERKRETKYQEVAWHWYI